MRYFLQHDECGRVVARFFMRDEGDDPAIFLSRPDDELVDYQDLYSELEVGQSIRFGGTKIIKRVA